VVFCHLSVDEKSLSQRVQQLESLFQFFLVFFVEDKEVEIEWEGINLKTAISAQETLWGLN
jgi:hypothetical protein